MVLKDATFVKGTDKNATMHPSFYDSLREISPMFINRENMNLFDLDIHWLRLKGTAYRESDDGRILNKVINTKIVHQITFPDTADKRSARAIIDNGLEFDFILSDECLQIMSALAQL